MPFECPCGNWVFCECEEHIFKDEVCVICMLCENCCNCANMLYLDGFGGSIHHWNLEEQRFVLKEAMIKKITNEAILERIYELKALFNIDLLRIIPASLFGRKCYHCAFDDKATYLEAPCSMCISNQESSMFILCKWEKERRERVKKLEAEIEAEELTLKQVKMEK